MRHLSKAFFSVVLASAYFATYAQVDPVVYVVDNGKKYHVKNCRLKSGSHAMKLSLAKKAGYTPCKVCKPPK